MTTTIEIIFKNNHINIHETKGNCAKGRLRISNAHIIHCGCADLNVDIKTIAKENFLTFADTDTFIL